MVLINLGSRQRTFTPTEIGSLQSSMSLLSAKCLFYMNSSMSMLLEWVVFQTLSFVSPIG